ncbi:hypothetical protein RN001_002636 [Aquatica leii]|uniref:BED-type domain-containing protein n=1 Tax=Aquatica leii TaxID=1421715 RepID=A0AAN7SSV7_9COLE|nr:hypothetical protein RN001_002636 [Aquatica leii]
MDKFLKRSTQPSTSTSSENSETKSKKKRLYDDNYLKLGFTVIQNKPQCVICFETLSRESTKLSKLVRHLNTKHPNCLYDIFLEATQGFHIDWAKKCIAICSDGAKAMTGLKSGCLDALLPTPSSSCS